MAVATLLTFAKANRATRFILPAPATGKFNTANQNIVLNVSTRDKAPKSDRKYPVMYITNIVKTQFRTTDNAII